MTYTPYINTSQNENLCRMIATSNFLEKWSHDTTGMKIDPLNYTFFIYFLSTSYIINI